MKTILEPNHETQFKSAVLGLQTAYNEYRQAINNYLKWTGYNNDGKFYAYSDNDIRANEVEKWSDEVSRRKTIVDAMLVLKGGEQE